MDEVADAIYPKLDEVGYTLSNKAMDRVTRTHSEFQTASVLRDTNSFWEGIDLPGEALRAVVITRLPFTSPDRPVTRARLLAIEVLGNHFLEYSVPQAILRLKQGFGRLIRTKNDIGGVIILDERILSSRYGEGFLASYRPPVLPRSEGLASCLSLTPHHTRARFHHSYLFYTIAYADFMGQFHVTWYKVDRDRDSFTSSLACASSLLQPGQELRPGCPGSKT